MKKIFIAALSLSMIAVSCKKGDTGPAGPVGPQGPAGTNGTNGTAGTVGPVGPVGPAGPAGPQGTPGATGATGSTGATGAQGPQGNANVATYLWTTPAASVIDGTLNGQNVYRTDFPLAQINTSVLSTGAVLVYVESQKNTNIWFEVPRTVGTQFFVTNFGVGLLSIYTNQSSTAISQTRVRIVIIGGPGTGPTVVNRLSSSWKNMSQQDRARALYPNVDFSDFNAVKKAFNLK